MRAQITQEVFRVLPIFFGALIATTVVGWDDPMWIIPCAMLGTAAGLAMDEWKRPSVVAVVVAFYMIMFVIVFPELRETKIKISDVADFYYLAGNDSHAMPSTAWGVEGWRVVVSNDWRAALNRVAFYGTTKPWIVVVDDGDVVPTPLFASSFVHFMTKRTSHYDVVLLGGKAFAARVELADTMSRTNGTMCELFRCGSEVFLKRRSGTDC